MKQVIILHGWGEKPDSFWIPYVVEELTKKGYRVDSPQLPNTENPELEEQVSYVLNNFTLTPDTIFISHSSGTPVGLGILEKTDAKIKQFISVAGYSSALKEDSENTKNIKPDWNWARIKQHCREFIFINAANDPWGADDKQGRSLFNNLGGVLIINMEGHMGSEYYHQPYKQFPLLIKLIN